MMELTRSNDVVLLSWLRARLAGAGIEFAVFDAHTSSAYMGGLAAVASRIMVIEDQMPLARIILAEGRRIQSAQRNQ